ncbi:type III-A CRISPR-associated protein Cas10/Csm1 [Pyrococcus kukulkanii]|uniref:HD domain-containing protein n=1 Tax=Pyrococcus kukulkanii TaxID=1609559 RepID=A0A127BAE8_9EURY|nr:HD domain-containing protein [Pyrococcus kukulkanii]AMM54165.1 hypothetical protein TQ32_06500 [Pyrococcus kukulkanii]
MDIKELIALGGLFHDIGKPVQRAHLYSGDHSIQGYRFLLELARETGVKEYETLALFARYHHRKYMEEVEKLKISDDVKVALYLVYIADNISSREREDERSGYDVRRPLKSVFNRDLSYPLYQLSLERLPIPETVERIGSEEYRRIVEALKGDMKRVEPRTDKVMPILEKHLTFVSSVTTENNVISLYDHLKMTSAIALALYNAGCRPRSIGEAEKCMKEKNLLLIEGDFSGIQNFIYSVGGKGTLSKLAFQIEVIDDLLRDMDLPKEELSADELFKIAERVFKGRIRESTKVEVNRIVRRVGDVKEWTKLRTFFPNATPQVDPRNFLAHAGLEANLVEVKRERDVLFRYTKDHVLYGGKMKDPWRVISEILGG